MVNNFMLKSLPDIELTYPAISSVLLVLVSTILILYQFENRDKLEKIEELSKYISSIVGHSESVKFFIKTLMKLIIILSNEYHRLRKVFVSLTGNFTAINPMLRNEAKKKYVSNHIDREIRKFYNHKKDIREYKEIFTLSYERNIDKMYLTI